MQISSTDVIWLTISLWVFIIMLVQIGVIK